MILYEPSESVDRCCLKSGKRSPASWLKNSSPATGRERPKRFHARLIAGSRRFSIRSFTI
jgi:hypothetical protein